MIRAEAVGLVARDEALRLTPAERAGLLAEWWSWDADEDEWREVPAALRAERASSPEPRSPDDRSYDPLIERSLAASLIGVTNEYLRGRLRELGLADAIEGEPEAMQGCPCCGFLSLRARGQYDICRVCFWEDDGVERREQYSHANHATLAEAQHSFARIGATSEAMRQHVLADGPRRYARP